MRNLLQFNVRNCRFNIVGSLISTVVVSRPTGLISSVFIYNIACTVSIEIFVAIVSPRSSSGKENFNAGSEQISRARIVVLFRPEFINCSDF